MGLASERVSKARLTETAVASERELIPPLDLPTIEAPSTQRASASTFAHLLDARWLPRAVDDRLVGPVGTDVERERAIRRRQPVAAAYVSAASSAIA
jgi:hypothetical protein